MEKIIVIVGPTGVGKTQLSIALAKKLEGSVINADSMQIYRDLDIGTSKITDDEKDNIKHYLVDIIDIHDNYSVYNYQQDCRNSIKKIIEEKKTPIIVGGTGLYIKAALYDYHFKKDTTNNYKDYSNEQLYNLLLQYDPDTEIHINNRRRIERAITHYQDNDSIDNDSKRGHELLYDALFIGLTMPRELLYKRINSRVDKMLGMGLLEEAKSFYDQGIKTKPLVTGIGYKELYQYFDNQITLVEAISMIKQNSRHYAKRQYTWFNNQMNINWFEVDLDNFKHTVDEVLAYIKKHF